MEPDVSSDCYTLFSTFAFELINCYNLPPTLTSEVIRNALLWKFFVRFYWDTRTRRSDETNETSYGDTLDISASVMLASPVSQSTIN